MAKRKGKGAEGQIFKGAGGKDFNEDVYNMLHELNMFIKEEIPEQIRNNLSDSTCDLSAYN